jgi:phosphoglycolate phosphatase-like HAD superfamily hydrolase
MATRDFDAPADLGGGHGGAGGGHDDGEGRHARGGVPRGDDRGGDIAVIDIDGVLADVRHRLHHLRKRPKDWEAFFAEADHDPPLAEGFAVARTLADRHRIVYLSGRPERLRSVTERWLRRHGAPSGTLLLRLDGDFRPARRVKLERLRRLADQARVVVVVDDDPEVCATLRAAGFPVLQATWGFGEEAEGEAARTLHDAQEREGRT